MSKIIHDVVWGDMYIPAPLMQLVDTPEFQRLGRINQLGPVHYVYPTATHTRKSHSLGVAHAAGLWMRHFGIFSEHDILLEQTTGLFHDGGHVWTSHLFDKIVPTIKFHDDSLKTHENRSEFMFRHLVREHKLNYNEEDVNTICDLIHGRKTRLPNLISNDIDVDRLDYLRRDSYYTGVPIGFQTDRIIDNSFLDENGEIKYKKKAQTNLDQFLHTRTLFYSEIYCHHTVQKINHMLLEAMSYIKEDIEAYFKADNRWMTELDDYAGHYLLMRNPRSARIMRKIEERKLTSP